MFTWEPWMTGVVAFCISVPIFFFIFCMAAPLSTTPSEMKFNCFVLVPAFSLIMVYIFYGASKEWKMTPEEMITVTGIAPLVSDCGSRTGTYVQSNERPHEMILIKSDVCRSSAITPGVKLKVKLRDLNALTAKVVKN